MASQSEIQAFFHCHWKWASTISPFYLWKYLNRCFRQRQPMFVEGGCATCFIAHTLFFGACFRWLYFNKTVKKNLYILHIPPGTCIRAITLAACVCNLCLTFAQQQLQLNRCLLFSFPCTVVHACPVYLGGEQNKVHAWKSEQRTTRHERMRLFADTCHSTKLWNFSGYTTAFSCPMIKKKG